MIHPVPIMWLYQKTAMQKFAWIFNHFILNKANLRGEITATILVISFQLDTNHRFFVSHNLEIWWMTSKNNGHISYAKSRLVYLFKTVVEFKLSRNAQFGSKSRICCHVWPWNLRGDLKSKRVPLLCYFVHHSIVIRLPHDWCCSLLLS